MFFWTEHKEAQEFTRQQFCFSLLPFWEHFLGTHNFWTLPISVWIRPWKVFSRKEHVILSFISLIFLCYTFIINQQVYLCTDISLLPYYRISCIVSLHFLFLLQYFVGTELIETLIIWNIYFMLVFKLLFL